ncbi:MAG: hypothetical protein ACREA0_24095, partial [bacterium]
MGLIVLPPLSQLEVVGTTPGRGFMSLYPYARHLIAGTYGPMPVQSYASDGISWHEMPSGALATVGESLFAMTRFSKDGQLYGATESTGKTVRFALDGWHVVFQAPGGWNNSYSVVDYGGVLVTGFNVYPDNDRSLLAWSTDGVTWAHHTILGMHHPRFTTDGTNLFIAWPNLHGEVEVWDQGLRQIMAVPGTFVGQPYWWRGGGSGNGALFLAVETGEGEPCRVYRNGQHVASLDGQQVGSQFLAHENELWLASLTKWRGTGNGALWASPDGLTWTRRVTLPEPEGWCLAQY